MIKDAMREREGGSCYDAVGHLSLVSLPEPMQFIRPFRGLPRVTFKTNTSTLDIVVGAVIACGQLLANNSNYRGVRRRGRGVYDRLMYKKGHWTVAGCS